MTGFRNSYRLLAALLATLAIEATGLPELKALFKADFGEEPFVDVDIAYFDDPAMPEGATARTW